MTTSIARPSRSSTSAGARARATADRAWIVGFACAVGLVVTVGLWFRHGELGAATGPGALATALGQLTALVGTYLILVQILLMSRLVWLERALGLGRLAVWHRWLGFTTLWLITAHVVFTTVGYARGDQVSLWAQTRDFVLHYPDVLMAWVGFALLVMVAVASIRIARRKLQRETWYALHLYTYLAVALAFAHQLAVGTDFDGDRAARVWWVSLYVAVFGAVLLWRVGLPAYANLRSPVRVKAVRPEAPGVVSIFLGGRDLQHLDAAPGQFFLFRFLTPRHSWQAHPFSLSATPTDTQLRITVKDLGDRTRELQKVRPGTRVLIEGPYGTFTSPAGSQRRVLLIAGGIGITPLRAMLDDFGPGDDVVVLYRVAYRDEVVFVDELKRFAQAPHIRMHVIPGAEVGDDETDLLSIPLLRRGVPDIESRDCFVCGPPGMVDALRRRLRKLGVPRRHIHYERFEL